LTKVAKELEKLVNAFHPTSPVRLEFEKTLRNIIKDLTHRYWDNAVHKVYGPLSTRVTLDSVTSPIPPKDSISVHLSRNLLSHLSFNSSHSAQTEEFASFLIYGDGSPDKLEDRILENLDRSILATALHTPFYSHILSQDYQNQKMKWQANLVETVERVLEHKPADDIAGLAYSAQKSAFDHLINFVETFAESHNRDSETAKLARFFFRYLLEQVAARTDEENLTKSLAALLLREKRAYADYFEFHHRCREVLKVAVEAPGFFESGRNFPVPIVAYHDIWTKSYFEVVKARSSDDIFRLIAVDLINPLIFETIHYSLNLFKSGRVQRESSKQLKVLAELEHHRGVLAKAAEQFHQQLRGESRSAEE